MLTIVFSDHFELDSKFDCLYVYTQEMKCTWIYVRLFQKMLSQAGVTICIMLVARVLVHTCTYVFWSKMPRP
jgi:hypothetical protein